MILDGYGINEKEEGNAVALANTPNIDELMKTNPTTKIRTSGIEVGLPEGQMGNSEAGYMNIAAGRVVEQDLTRITKAIEEGDFFSNEALCNTIEYCQKSHAKLHIMGLLSDGGVHSHIRHLFALLELAKRKGLEDVYVHCFLDGRDTPPASAEGYLLKLEEKMREKEIGKIATLSGRFYAMDHDQQWQKIQRVYDAMVKGIGEKANSVEMAIEASYQKEIFDEFVEPTVICNGDKPVATIEDGDAVVCFNLRADGAIEITRALVDKHFGKFETEKMSVKFVSFTQYDEALPTVQVAFQPMAITYTLEDCLKMHGKACRKIEEQPKAYEEKEKTSLQEMTEEVIKQIKSQTYDVIIARFESIDMAGHRGSLEGAIREIEAMDECVGRIVQAIKEVEGVLLLTSGHGNVEQMVDYQTGEPHTAHTTNLVPLVLCGMDNVKLKAGKLADIAPTILDIMKINKPKEMTGESLIENKR